MNESDVKGVLNGGTLLSLILQGIERDAVGDDSRKKLSRIVKGICGIVSDDDMTSTDDDDSNNISIRRRDFEVVSKIISICGEIDLDDGLDGNEQVEHSSSLLAGKLLKMLMESGERPNVNLLGWIGVGACECVSRSGGGVDRSLNVATEIAGMLVDQIVRGEEGDAAATFITRMLSCNVAVGGFWRQRIVAGGAAKILGEVKAGNMDAMPALAGMGKTLPLAALHQKISGESIVEVVLNNCDDSIASFDVFIRLVNCVGEILKGDERVDESNKNVAFVSGHLGDLVRLSLDCSIRNKEDGPLCMKSLGLLYGILVCGMNADEGFELRQYTVDVERSLAIVVGSKVKCVRVEAARVRGLWVGVGGFGLVP